MGLECLPRFARCQGQHVRHYLLPSFRRGRPSRGSTGENPRGRRWRCRPPGSLAATCRGWWMLPPPRTTSSGSSAAMRQLTTSSTSRRHCVMPCACSAGTPDVSLEGCVPVRQVTQLHRLHDAVDDHGGAQTGAEPEKQHLAAVIAAQRLHRGVVHHLDRHPNAFGSRIRPSPGRGEAAPRPDDREAPGREADRDRVVRPVRGDRP
jgi:hypothetical protein